MEHLEIKLPEKYKNVIKDATIELVDGKIIITPKTIEFKNGDIVYWEDKNNIKNNGIAIFKCNTNKCINFYIDLINMVGLISDYPFIIIDNNIIFRLASEEEKQLLFDALEKDGKRWNPETKQIEDILKVGDLAIFWDCDKSKAIISTLLESHPENNYPDKMYKSTSTFWYKNAIKCTSLEQYINFKK